MRIKWILGILLLTACNTAQQDEIGQQEEAISWEEKSIADIIKYEGWDEKNLDLSMEQLIEKKEACIKYGTKAYGEGFKELDNGMIGNEYKYSPRFDKCLLHRKYHDFGGSSVDPISKTIIIDVVSENVLFSRDDDCENRIDKSLYTPNEFHDLFCPYDWEIINLWDALIDRKS